MTDEVDAVVKALSGGILVDAGRRDLLSVAVLLAHVDERRLLVRSCAQIGLLLVRVAIGVDVGFFLASVQAGLVGEPGSLVVGRVD